jgi:hypothetical protein
MAELKSENNAQIFGIISDVLKNKFAEDLLDFEALSPRQQTLLFEMTIIKAVRMYLRIHKINEEDFLKLAKEREIYDPLDLLAFAEFINEVLGQSGIKSVNEILQ